jgi:hypothetical protein
MAITILEELTKTCWIINDASNIVITIYTLCWSWSYILEFTKLFSSSSPLNVWQAVVNMVMNLQVP